MTRFVLTLVVVLLLPHAEAWAAKAKASENFKVRVTLRNGARIVGVVRDGAMYETKKPDGRFARAKGPRVAGAGFRLWHVAESPGYLWIAHRDVRRFEQLALLSKKELYQMQQNLRDRAGVIVIPEHRRKAEESEETEGEGAGGAGDAKSDSGDKPAIGPAPPPGVDAGGKPADDDAAEPEELTPGELLLAKFPPSEGWLPERRDEIERRKWVLGVFPTPEEKEFLENFPVWKEAYDAWLKELIESKKPAKPADTRD